MGSTRRSFLRGALGAGVAAAAAPWLPGGAPARRCRRWRRGDAVRVGVIGVRGRGRAHVGAFKKSKDAEVVAICDADEGVIAPAMRAVPGARYYRDLRALLDDPGVDAVSIATPNHWHALAAIWALHAGKHVYVEKPISHDLREGRVLVEVARASGLVLQHGTQSRSAPATRDALAWLRSGGLGAVRVARGLCYKRRDSIGLVEGPQQPPATLDYDLWTGPAELQPLRRKNLHYDWHWVFNTGNGDLGNQGAHQLDIARWGLGRDDWPRRVVSGGGRLGYRDDGETPNTQIAVFDYGDAQIVFEVRGLPTEAYQSTSVGVVFHCEHGQLVSSSYGKVHALDGDGAVIRTFAGGDGDIAHFQNFLDAVKAGDPSAVHADAREGQLSSALCHLGNISYRLGSARPLRASDAPFGAVELANEAFRRCRAHLVDNGVDLGDSWTTGPLLTFDGDAQRFVGPRAEEANRLGERPPRQGFELPSLAGGERSLTPSGG